MSSRRLTFFTDENIPPYFGRMLDDFDQTHEVRACLDYFERGIIDVEWIRKVASWKNPVAICGDGRILRNDVEKKVLKECGLTFVHLAPGWTNMKWQDQAWKIIKAWPDIVRNIQEASYPMLFEVAVGGKVYSRGRISSL